MWTLVGIDNAVGATPRWIAPPSIADRKFRRCGQPAQPKHRIICTIYKILDAILGSMLRRGMTRLIGRWLLPRVRTMESQLSQRSNDPPQKVPGIIRGFVSIQLAISDRPLCCSLNTNQSGGLKTDPTVHTGPRSHWRSGISGLSSPDEPDVRSNAPRLRRSALSTQRSAMRPGRLKLFVAL
jgi:hypothetical protein